MMGCPECGSLDSEHKPGCTWKERHPSIGGMDSGGEYYVVAHYVGNDFLGLKMKQAKVYASAEGPEWCEATFTEPCTVSGMETPGGYRTPDLDGMRARFLFRRTDFRTDEQRDPLDLLAELSSRTIDELVKRRDGVRPSPRINLDQLSDALGIGEPDTAYYVKASDIPHSGKEVVDNSSDERATASDIDDTFLDMYFCTPADAAVAYSLWDMNNTTRLTTPREFDRMYPEATRFLFWLGVHKHEVISHEERAKCRLYRRLWLGGLAFDLIVIGAAIAALFYFSS
jgi:hypothetical protein